MVVILNKLLRLAVHHWIFRKLFRFSAQEFQLRTDLQLLDIISQKKDSSDNNHHEMKWRIKMTLMFRILQMNLITQLES